MDQARRSLTPLAGLGALGLALAGVLAVDTAGPVAPPAPLAAPLEPVHASILDRRATDVLASFGSAVAANTAIFDKFWSEDRSEPPAPTPVVKTLSVGRGDTLMRLLTGAGADIGESAQAIEALGAKFNPKKLQQGQEITVTFERGEDASYRLASLGLSDRAERTLSVTRTESGFATNEVLHAFDMRPVRAGGTIDTSLYAAALDAGIPMPVLTEMIKLFSYDVDFQREVQPGDTFEVFYESFQDDGGKTVKTGLIHSAAMRLRGEEIRYFRYKPRDGEDDYFTIRGMSVRKALLRTPIDGARLTSGFGTRTHPVLGFTKVHRGVDFGAPAGTPIQAAGDGVVELAGVKGGYGNYVRLRHNNSYSTAYAHMSRIAVKAGARVRQGQIIGYVGSTGMSTGPHLHYETLLNNAQINPLSIRLPTGRKLEGAEYTAFLKSVGALQEEMATTPLKSWIAASPE